MVVENSEVLVVGISFSQYYFLVPMLYIYLYSTIMWGTYAIQKELRTFHKQLVANQL